MATMDTHRKEPLSDQLLGDITTQSTCRHRLAGEETSELRGKSARDDTHQALMVTRRFTCVCDLPSLVSR